MIWEAFNGEIPNGYEINHKNEVRDDNRLSNLELVSHYDNLMYGSRKERHKESLKKVVRRGGACNFANPITIFDSNTGKTTTYASRVEAAKQYNIEKKHFSYLIKKSKKSKGIITIEDNVLKFL